jgi:hypothetical protein
MSDKTATATGATPVGITVATGAVVGKAPVRIGAMSGPAPDCSADG